MDWLRSRSKSRTRQPERLFPLHSAYSVSPANVPFDGVPIITTKKRSRANSYVTPIFSTPNGVYYGHVASPPSRYAHVPHLQHCPQCGLSYANTRYSAQMNQQPSRYSYYEGQVVYPRSAPTSGHDTSPRKLNLDSQDRGRSRFRSSTAEQREIHISCNTPTEPVSVPSSGPSGDKKQQGACIFTSLIDAILSRSKSYSRSLFPSIGQPKPAATSNTSSSDPPMATMLPEQLNSPARPASSRNLAPKGWYNSRGDQLVGPNSVIRQPPDCEYQPCFRRYPAPGQGYADSAGNVIDMDGRLIKRVG